MDFILGLPLEGGPRPSFLKMNRTYLDYNATTPVEPEVLEAMLPYLRDRYGNPSSIHGFGQEAKKGMEEARERVARLIHADPMEIVFTGSGTEADNLAIKGVAHLLGSKGSHIITSSIEHHAVLNTCKHLEKEGFEVTYLPVDQFGRINPDEVRKAVTRETILITIMHSNNEVGTIEPLGEIGEIAKGHGVLLHTDAVQSIGKVPIDVRALGADLLSMSAHKVYGPKGIGALFIKRGISIENQIHGGHHEMDRRAGTENVSGIVGFGKAAELAGQVLLDSEKRMKGLRDYLWEEVRLKIDHVYLNGHPEERLPNTLNLSFEFIEGESTAISLDLQGVAVSTGSACTSGAIEPSHVLVAMGVPTLLGRGSLRFSLGRGTTKEEIDRTVEALVENVGRLRSISPLYVDRMKGRR